MQHLASLVCFKDEITVLSVDHLIVAFGIVIYIQRDNIKSSAFDTFLVVLAILAGERQRPFNVDQVVHYWI